MKKMHKIQFNMKLITLCFCTLILLSACEKEGDTTEQLNGPEYYKEMLGLEMGKKWTYSLSVSDSELGVSGSGKAVFEIVDIDEDTYTIHQLETINENEFKNNTYKISLTENEVFMHFNNGSKYPAFSKDGTYSNKYVAFLLWIHPDLSYNKDNLTTSYPENNTVKEYYYSASSTNLGYTCGTDREITERCEKGKGVTYFKFHYLRACFGLNSSTELDYIYTLDEN